MLSVDSLYSCDLFEVFSQFVRAFFKVCWSGFPTTARTAVTCGILYSDNNQLCSFWSQFSANVNRLFKCTNREVEEGEELGSKYNGYHYD